MNYKHPANTGEGYRERVDACKEKYEPRILRIIQGLIDATRAAGYYVEGPYEMHDEQYEWGWRTWAKGSEPVDGDMHDEDSMDHTFSIAESKVYGDKLEGIAFCVGSCWFGGALEGPSLRPYNYTSDVWVSPDPEDGSAADNRLQIFEEIDPAEWVACLNQIHGLQRHGRSHK